MLLYPRLPPSVARNLAKELSSRTIESLGTLRRTNHPAATYAATGGSRVSEQYLLDIDRHIRESAQSFGYPSTMGEIKFREFDANSGKILHEMMSITPSEASHSGMWAFMACVIWPDIVRWRFPGDTEGTSIERFMGGRRNTFGRVWWRAYILKQPNDEHPYRLLELLSEDELVQITERPSLAGSPVLAREVCKTFLELTNVPSDIPQSRLILREVMKRLRRLLPMVSFDALDDQALKYVIDEVFQLVIQNLRN